MEHKRVKGFYKQTNRNNAQFQIASHVQREKNLNRVQNRITHSSPELEYSNAYTPYDMSHSTRSYISLSQFLFENATDPATTVCLAYFSYFL